MRRDEEMKAGLLALAMPGVLLAMCAMPAHADEEEVAALENPTNSVEVGAASTSHSSAKFGEYNGLNKSGASAVGNFSVRGGDAYGGRDGTRRWSITGSDLGTTSRALAGTVSSQGQWKLGIGYDELRHNLSDTYQTPYQGGAGGNSFVLSPGFGLVGSAAPGTRTLSAAQLANLNSVDIATTRKNGSLTAGVNLNAQWDLQFKLDHLERSGARLMALGSMANAATAPTVTGEAVSILPNPTKSRTDTIELALNWVGDKKSHVTASYFGSFFRDGYDRLNFQTYMGTASAVQTMSTAPGNDFHQFNLSGGHAFTSQTKLTGGFSYARNTQNDAYVVDSISMVAPAPQGSLNGLVNTTHADLKLSSQSSRDLVLTAGMKFDERKNRTASNFYNFNALDYSVAHQAVFPNTPYSNRKTHWELAGDYRLDRDQHLRLTYVREDVKRWCEQYAASTGVAPGAAGYYPAGANCVVATASKDDKLSAAYRIKAGDTVDMNLGYSYSKRRTDSDPNAITARIGTNGNTAAPLIMGLNAGDFRGFSPFFDASRKEQMVKARVNWQAAEKWAWGVEGRYTDDKYDSAYGVQNGNAWSLNLDSAYGYSDSGSISAYLTQQHRQRQLTDLQTAATAITASATRLSVPAYSTWTDHLKDDETTIGLGAKEGGLLGASLDLAGDLTYSLGRTGYGTQLNYAGATTGGLTCSAASILSCGDLPVIRNRMLQFKLSGSYRLDKRSRIGMGYLFQQLKSDDYYYNGLQYGYTPTALMPSNQQAPRYSVTVVNASYVYDF